MKLRVWIEKLMLVLHFRTLGEAALAHRLYQEQRAEGWPGLAAEAEEICRELQVESCNVTRHEKQEYRKIVTDACHRKNEEMLRKMSEGKEKCSRMIGESYGKKKYIEKRSVKEVRIWYRSRYGQQPFAGNFSKDKNYAKTNWLCRCQKMREKEIHITSGDCPVYSDIREQYTNFDSDEDLVSYFAKVLERRDAIDQLEQDERDSC